jgi:hypothetical protein
MRMDCQLSGTITFVDGASVLGSRLIGCCRLYAKSAFTIRIAECHSEVIKLP